MLERMQASTVIPSQTGTYVLILRLSERKMLRIGRLGECEFHVGHYAYLGSAQGSGGLAGRLGRHLKHNRTKPAHWHIDHLIRSAEITQIWWEVGSPSCECLWADTLSAIGTRTIPGFGSSDCRCPGHLIWFPKRHKQSWSECMQTLSNDLRTMVISPSSNWQ